MITPVVAALASMLVGLATLAARRWGHGVGGLLSAFPLIIRLRNDADLRAGRKYLSVDTQIAQVLDTLDEPDGSGRVDAVRVFRQPPPPAAP